MHFFFPFSCNATVIIIIAIQSPCPFLSLRESRSGCDCSGLTLQVAVRFQTPLTRPPPPSPPPSLFRAQARAADWQSGAFRNNNSGGSPGPGEPPPPPGPAARLAPPAGSPPPRPPRGLTGPTGARPRRPPCTPLCGSWRTTSATRCQCRACATSAPARGWILTTRRCTPCTGARRSWAPGPRAPRAPPATGARCCSTRPRSWRWQVSERAGRDGGTRAGAGTRGRGGRGEPLLAPASSARLLGFSFGDGGVSKRPDQLKTPDGPLCLPRLPDTPALSVCLHRSVCVCRPLSVSVCSPGPFTFSFLSPPLHSYFSASHLLFGPSPLCSFRLKFLCLSSFKALGASWN